MSLSGTKTGFLGASSYSADYDEKQAGLGIDEPDASPRRSVSPALHPISAELIHKGAEVLALLRDIRIFDCLMNRWLETGDGILVIKPFYCIWINEIIREFGQVLAQHERVEQLYGLSELVWRNTQVPMRFTGKTSPEQYALMATGNKLRWESLGLIFTGVAILASSLSDWDSFFSENKERLVDRPTFTRRMRVSIEACISYCKECEIMNELFVALLYESTIVLETIRGDAYYGAWQRMGETCDFIVMMGLHQEKRVDENTPFMICEMRKRLFELAYSHDKSIATFLGRPPRLSHRYCVLQQPSDLNDAEMFLEGAELDAVLARLDENGWNTSKRLSRATWRRAWSQHSLVREDILELSLGTSGDDIALRASQIRARLQEIHQTMPDFMKANPEEVLNAIQPPSRTSSKTWHPDHMPLNVIYMLCIHCGMLHTEFELERALVKRAKQTPKDLIPVARRLLALVLHAMAKRDYLRDFTADLVCLLSLHGMPCAGVLAIELLKQEQSCEWTPDILPRSETIQDLSVFISALATVGPGEGNHAICNQGRRALKKILDKILAPHPPSVSTALPPHQTALDTSLYFPTGNDAEFLQWLENVEWEGGNWFHPV